MTFGSQHLISVNTLLLPIMYWTMPRGKLCSNFLTLISFFVSIFLSTEDSLRLAGVISNYCFHNVGVVNPFETVTMIKSCTNKLDSQSLEIIFLRHPWGFPSTWKRFTFNNNKYSDPIITLTWSHRPPGTVWSSRTQPPPPFHRAGSPWWLGYSSQPSLPSGLRARLSALHTKKDAHRCTEVVATAEQQQKKMS